MLFRCTVEADVDRVLACTDPTPLDRVTPATYPAGLADGHYRPEWTWVAEESGRVVARAVWWGFPGGEHPLVLDCVDTDPAVADPAAVAADLLAAAHDAFARGGAPEPPEYQVFLPTAWRDDPDLVAALSWRLRAVRRAGLTDELERFRYEWTPDAGVPEPSARLVFTAEPDDRAFLDAFVRVSEGSLDVYTRRGLAAHGALRQAREDMSIYQQMPGERGWWRLAHTADGALAGLAVPSRNAAGPVVGYLGVVPELRGRGYVDDLLAETTRILAATGTERIRADTDVTNRPMAAAFDRAGYRAFGVRLVVFAPAAG